MLRDITCSDCGMVLGQVDLDRDPDGYLCEECWYKLDTYPRRWLELDAPIESHRLRSPIPDFEVYMTEPYFDVHVESDDEITVDLLELDGTPATALLMGVRTRRLVDGETTFTGLYVGLPGTYMLKLSSPGHDDVLTNGFEVT